MHRSAPLLLLFAAACASEPPPPPPPPVATASAPEPLPEPTLTPPTLRLPKTAAPTRYRLALTVKPGDKSFQGEATIDLDVAEPTRVLWLNAEALSVTRAALEPAEGGPIDARAVQAGEDFVGFVLAREAPRGHARLRVTYTGTISDKDDRGVFVEDEEGLPYVFTQFESTHARRAFPCFDEPAYKVPWQLSLRVPEGDVALSNTPVLSEAKEPGTSTKTVTFAETAPLPSYLVAFAVGPFDLVDAGKAGKKAIPVRIAVPKGQGSQAAYAAATTPAAIARLEDYLGVPYPYEKLDVVAVPRLVTFGAMENAGLVTFTRFGLLARPEEQTTAFEMRLTGTMTHELGHHWFGDLVTTAWWDDIWLNEAFATWITTEILAPWKPAWHMDVGRERRSAYAMQTDALASARRIRQPIASKDDVFNAFDEITYSKGAAVIGMIEAYLGKDRFRRGLQRYLAKHANGNATAADLLAAVSAEAGQDIGPAFASFLDQPGVPVVGWELACKGGKAEVGLAQHRYRPLGSEVREPTRWQIPVCMRYAAGTKEARACTLLAGETGTLSLPEAKGCPAWVVPNDDAAGYYHATYRPKDVDALLRGKAKLSTVERIALASDLLALAGSEDRGGLTLADALARIPDLLRDPSPDVLRAAIDLAASVRDVMLAPADQERYARFLAKTFGARARALGWHAKPGEDEATRLVRPLLLTLVADRGRDAKLAAEADELAERWLSDPRSVPPDVVDAVLEVAAGRGKRPLFDRLRSLAKKEKDDLRRRRMLGAMARFRDPAIVRDALGILLGDEHDVRDALVLLGQDPRVADVTFAFVKEHYDPLVARLPSGTLGGLPNLGDAFCDDAHRADVEAFFKDRAPKLPGGPRNLAKALERVHLCAVERKAQEPSLRKLLERF